MSAIDASTIKNYFLQLFLQLSFLPPETVITFTDINFDGIGKISFSVKLSDVAIEPLMEG